MPATHVFPPSSPFTARTTPNPHSSDWPLIWVLITVGSIILLELILTIAWIRIHNLRSKARWKRLRQRGVVIVSGAALLWTKDLPLRPYISHINLRQAVEKQARYEELEVV